MTDATAAAEPVRITAPLRRSDYRRLWLAQTVSVVGDKLDQIALALLVYQRTGSMLQMGLMLAISALPAALFALPAGALVDRWDRRRTLVVTDLMRAGLVALVPLAAAVSIPLVYAIAFLVAGASLFFEPARLSLIPDLVNEEELTAANSLDNASSAAAELIGLALGGVVVAAVGWQIAFYADAATYLVSAAFVVSMAYRAVTRERLAESSAPFRRMAAEISEGLKTVWHNAVLRELMGAFLVLAFAGSALITLSHLLALYTYKGGSIALALLDAAVTAGILLGSLLVGRSGNTGSGLKFLYGTFVFGIATLVLALAPTTIWALAPMLVAGVANMFFLVPTVVLVQEHAPPETRGRVFAARTAVARISGAAGLAIAGIAAESYGVRPVIAVMGVTAILVALAGGLTPSLRRA